ncbi:MAG: DEAD/DEAH box helicase family protein, partial [Actinomycetes bacterium]
MVVTIIDLLDRFRELSTVNRDHGTWFEELMATYLETDPIYADRFSDVWMWMDWPDRGGVGDTGIDLVARERETGGYCAIQCKFYEPAHQLQKSDIDSFFTASGKRPFTSRLIVSTTDRWGTNAEKALENQQIPVNRLGMADLLASGIDWDIAWPSTPTRIGLPVAAKNTVRSHQRKAIDDVFAGFADHDRGKLIMACGTGKTFTSLKLAEELAARTDQPDTFVLFLVPSISLLSQTLREWTAQCQLPLRSFAVCSDTKVGKSDEDISAHDLAFPATTNPDKLVAAAGATAAFDAAGLPGEQTGKRLTVVFSTYQSIDVIHRAQAAGMPSFDLIVCDEAHRTTGVTLANQDESHFVKVHDNTYISATKRLYMTATPRLFRDDVKAAAEQKDAELCSMDDEALYGPEFHRLGFGEAVDKGLLTDYKVLILTVDEKYLTRSLQSQLADDNSELRFEDAVKIVGCWNGLAKRSGQFADGTGFGSGDSPMRRAVAFNRSIADSKKITERFSEVLDAYNDAHEGTLRIEIDHVDGTFNALRRTRLLQWLKEPTPDSTCRILSNAKCLSEGVDVPDLDAVLFLNPRNSQVDVVQSVGRVMRRAEGKDYGYIILPVGVPSDMEPAKALTDNKRYKVIWQVLQALRAHDDRFSATINKIDLNVKKPDQIMVGHVGGGDEDDNATSTPAVTNTPDSQAAGGAATVVHELTLFPVDEWRDAIYAKIVAKVGEKAYWEDWAKDVAAIAARHVDRITVLIEDPDSDKAKAFEVFLAELRANINPGVTTTDAIDMLAQHLITKPVFDALFAGYEFSSRNPVSLTMQKMLDTLEDRTLDQEADTLSSFYDSVRKRAEGIDNHEGRQKVITELYERFFKTALPKTADAFGIVYTPIPIVDFILRCTNQALQRHFGTDLSAGGVQVIDPFTGTGTFIVRLLQSGLIKPEDLLRKYTNELHANEIVLLAYYIAAINIEAAFHQVQSEAGIADGQYVPFDGIVLTDTFQLAETPATLDAHLFPENNDRLRRQKALDIRVVIGNPPYSTRQGSENDANQNQSYPALDERIEKTYAARSTVTNKNSLYDSYIRAIRWASDRIKTEGIVCFVSNGGYVDGNSADGLRLALADEFSEIYCFNLRGNQRTAGELSRKEGGKVFGSGSRSTVAILLLVKDPDQSGTCQIHYRDIGDYLAAEEKLATVGVSDLDSIEWLEGLLVDFGGS